MAALHAVPLEPYRNSTDTYGYTTRWLLERIPMTIHAMSAEDVLRAGMRPKSEGGGASSKA